MINIEDSYFLTRSFMKSWVHLLSLSLRSIPVKAWNFLPNFPLLLTKSINSCLQGNLQGADIYEAANIIIFICKFGRFLNTQITVRKKTWIRDDYHNPRKSDHAVSSSKLQLLEKLHPVIEVFMNYQIQDSTETVAIDKSYVYFKSASKQKKKRLIIAKQNGHTRNKIEETIFQTFKVLYYKNNEKRGEGSTRIELYLSKTQEQ